MRRVFLLNSVARVLGEGTVVRDAAYVWARHRWVVAYASAVWAVVVLTAPVFGVEDWPTRIVIGLGVMAVAINATTEYRILALTDEGLQLLKASRIRQVAVAPIRRLTADTELERVGGTMLASEWLIGDIRYTVPRSSELPMERMAATVG